jgi:uncharacterized protein involved in outer membrane biogenesis
MSIELRPSLKQRWFRRLELLTAFVLIIVLGCMLFDWNWLKGPIEREVSAETGRVFRINGNLAVYLSRYPRVTADDLTLGNLPGAHDPDMASIKRLEFRVKLSDLLRGRIVLPEMTVSEPRLLLEKNARGDSNWRFNGVDPDSIRWPVIQRLAIDAGTLIYRNPATRTDVTVALRSGDPTADAQIAPVLIDGNGRYTGNPFVVTGRIESPLALKDSDKPYRIDLFARAGDTRATADGVLIGPLQMQGFDLKFGLSGPDMALLYPLMGVATPNTPPYRLLGRLTRTGKTWHYDHFTGMVGDSDLGGDASVDTAGKRPFLRADLVSKRLDFDDLGGFVGAPPQTGAGETASEAQKLQAAELHASSRVLPDDQYHLDKLRNMDADVKLRAQRINAPSLPLEAMTAHLFVDDGVVRLDPLNFQAAGGEINSRIRMDARHDIIASTANIRLRGLKLPELFPNAKLTETSIGRLGGNLDLAGNGNSVARMLATSNGNIGLTMGTGRISNLLLEYAGIDIEESLKFLIGGDKTVPIRCGFGDFGVKQGVMTSRQLVFDTTDTIITGEGTIDLRDERLNLTLKPLPKDHSIFSLRSPLLLTGTFKDPSFRPDMKRVTLRGIAAAALAALAPPAALIPLFETGPGKDADCSAVVPGK